MGAMKNQPQMAGWLGLVLLTLGAAGGSAASSFSAEAGDPPPASVAGRRPVAGIQPGSFTSRHSLLVLGGATLATYWAWDEADDQFSSIQESIDGSFIDPAADLGNAYGNSLFVGGSSAALFGIGALTGHQELRDAGADFGRSFVYSALLSGLIKHAVDRPRPSTGSLSFPSGHTTAAWSTVPVAWHYTGWKGGLPVTFMATMTALGRMEEDRHYLSDVIAGGTIGYLVGRAVVASRKEYEGGPRIGAGPGGVTVSWRF